MTASVTPGPLPFRGNGEDTRGAMRCLAVATPKSLQPRPSMATSIGQSLVEFLPLLDLVLLVRALRHSGHSNTKIVQRYIRIANLDKKNATEDMGL